jgi:ribosomal protein S18 acetylase RimI-like enzyme
MSKVRPAEEGDLPFLREMLYVASTSHQDIGDKTFDDIMEQNAHWLEDWPRDTDITLIAEDEETSERQGAILCRILPIDPIVARIMIGVVPEHRGRGVATQLNCELIRVARERQVEAVRADTLPGNREAIDLAMKLGFKDWTEHGQRGRVVALGRWTAWPLPGEAAPPEPS